MYCENNIDECFSVQCVDGKQCFDLINGYECRCPVGFTGHLCQENINDCVANPCQNGGSCIDGIGNYTCSCPPGFTGRNCSEDIDECTVLKPCVYGICQNTIGKLNLPFWFSLFRIEILTNFVLLFRIVSMLLPAWILWRQLQFGIWRMFISSVPEQRNVQQFNQRLRMRLFFRIHRQGLWH